MGSIKGNFVSINSGETFTLNVPIKTLSAFTACNLIIDGFNFNITAGSQVSFPSIYGYPAKIVKNQGTATANFLIREFGDIVNPNYFTDWRS